MGVSLANAAVAVAVTSSVTQLYTVPTNYTRDVVVSNAGPNIIYLGGSAVGSTTATQYLALPVNESILLSGQSEAIYAVTASGTATAYVGNATNVLVS